MEQFIQQIKNRLREAIEYEDFSTDEELKQWIERQVLNLGARYTVSEKQQMIARIYHSIRGYDVLQPYIDDPQITEIMINGHDQIFIEREGQVLQAPMQFESKEKLEDVIQMIVGQVNRIVNESTPIVDARLPDGSRVNVVLPPIALDGPTMTIRKFPEQPIHMQDLVRFGSVTEEAADMLKMLVQAKYNIFIGGGTGSGKTTFLNALAQFIPPDERIITIEDSAELQIRTVPNLVRMETRNANTEGKGEIPIRQLIRSSLRMRPNRIVVGEVRGAEALDMLQAMNTGHDGSLSTGHANSTKDMISRLETMVLSAVQLPVEVIRQQIASAIDIFIHLSRFRDRSRRVAEISEVIGIENGQVLLNPLYVFEEHETSTLDHISGSLTATGHAIHNRSKLELAGFQRAATPSGRSDRI
ncbi:CpaF family protein [Marinicrinis sediminis]|uniref:CpaF family protein n=1 Tax=Marinicrinis sediminis TaxID=1652465 RepID=A0ABW5RF59_9BACL